MEVRPSLGGTAQLVAGTAFALAVIAGVTYWVWDQNFIIAGIMLIPCVILSFALAVLLFRLIARPVMLRVSDDGLYMRRLGTLIPWEALSHIERTDHDGTPLLVLVERSGGHPVFKTGNVAKGVIANNMAGLPPLPVMLKGLDTDGHTLAAAIANVSGLDIRESD